MSIKKFPRFTTPPATALTLHLDKAEPISRHEMQYSAVLRFRPGQADRLVAEAQMLAERKAAEVIKERPELAGLVSTEPPFGPPFEPEVIDGRETGNLIATFNMTAKVRKKDGTFFEQKPLLFDAARNRTAARPGSGSQVKVNFEMVPYFMEKDKEVGVSFRMYAVQIVETVLGPAESDAGKRFRGERLRRLLDQPDRVTNASEVVERTPLTS